MLGRCPCGCHAGIGKRCRLKFLNFRKFSVEFDWLTDRQPARTPEIAHAIHLLIAKTR